MADYNVVVIGAGPGGYVAAIRCAQLGLSTACIDEWVNDKGQPSLGGVCLNVGCIPSKAVLDSSHHYHQLTHELPEHGIIAKQVEIDVARMQARKQAVVDSLTSGIGLLFLKHKVKHIHGHAKLLAGNRISVETKDGMQEIEADNIIIATGSTPAPIKEIDFDGDRVVDSTGALAFKEVPKRFAVIGAGVVGLELGSVWSRLGAETTILNRGQPFLRAADQQVAQAVYKKLTEQGLNIRLGANLIEARKTAKQVKLRYSDNSGEHDLQVDRLLIATGRLPNSAAVSSEALGLKIDERGFIAVDEHCRTNLPNVYAIGDVVRGPMLAHKASEEGIAVAETIAGRRSQINYAVIPWVIYTWPELAWVGKTSEQLSADGVEFRAGVFPFMASGRARAMGATAGMVKILSDARTDTILGVHIFGPNASELISEAVVAMEFSASSEDLARTIHAHPTLSEAVHEAALAVDGRAIHS